MDNSSGIPSFKRAKTMRGKRHLQQRGALTIENPKKILYLRGTKCPQLVCDIFQDLHKMTKPQSRNFSRKRDLRPMEDEAELERLSSVQDVSLFAVGTSNKKRPSAITFARMFDHHLLDMCEFQVTDYKAMADFKDVLKPGLGNKPIVLFHGHGWDHSTDFRNAKSMLMDVFRGPVAKKLFLGGIDRVVVFTAEEPQIRMQQFLVTFKKSGTRLPIVKLTECGPYLGLKMGRTRWAADGLMKQALRIPDDLKAKKKKNIARNEMGETMGRVHMQRQDFNQMQTRKMKGLKRRTAAKAPGGNDNDEE